MYRVQYPKILTSQFDGSTQIFGRNRLDHLYWANKFDELNVHQLNQQNYKMAKFDHRQRQPLLNRRALFPKIQLAKLSYYHQNELPSTWYQLIDHPLCPIWNEMEIGKSERRSKNMKYIKYR